MSRALTVVGENTDTTPLCTMPITRGKTCPEPVVVTGKPGQKPAFCANPDHNSAAKYRLTQKWNQEDKRKEPQEPQSTGRPISESTVRMVDVAAELTRVVGEARALMEDARELAAVATDQDSLQREIAAVQREADVRIAQAESAQADAERRAGILAAERDQAEALAQDASDAADEAIEARTKAEERAAAVEQQAAQELRHARAEMTDLRKALDTAKAAVSSAITERDALRKQLQDETRALRADFAKVRDGMRRDLDSAWEEVRALREERKQ